MKIGLRGGHSKNCVGAVGIVNEYDQMQEYFKYVRDLLVSHGHIVIDCNSNGSNANAELSEGTTKANSANVDLFISLHMNAFDGSGNGVECVVSSVNSEAYETAKKICNNFSTLGFKNRGVKFNKLYEMNHIKAPNLIFEICFCDNSKDIQIYNRYSWEQLANTLCNAIDKNISKEAIKYIKKETGYVVTNYLPNGNKGDRSFEGVDLEYVLSYFQDVKCYIRGNSKGIWLETQVLPITKCNELEESLGSWFYSIE